jgi:hypothetical protein
MSGALSPQLSAAAGAAALVAEQMASGLSMPVFVRRRVHERMARRAPIERDSLPARTWRAMSIPVRTAFVMLSIDTQRDPREVALQSWDSFSDADKSTLAAIAREFHTETRDARALW